MALNPQTSQQKAQRRPVSMFLTRAKATRKTAGKAGPLAVAVADAKLRLEAFILQAFWWVCRLLGPERASNTGARLITWFSGPNSNVMRRIRRNLKVALPYEDPAVIERLARQGVVNLGRSVAEYPHLQRIAGPELAQFIDYVADVPEAALTPERKPAIYIGVHQANWEILSSMAAPLGKPMTIVVSPLSNPYVHRLTSKARPDVWVEQSERDNATRSLLRCLQEGRSVGLLADQRFEGGQLVPFFGQDAMTAMGPAKIAIKLGLDLVPCRIERTGPVKFRITTHQAVRPDETIEDDQEKAVDMMRRVNKYFEAWIREKPGEWMCMKRRWPKEVYQTLDHRQHPPASKASSDLPSTAKTSPL